MRNLPGICMAALIGLSFATTTRADEEKIPLDKVPKAVMKAFKAKFPQATIKNAIKEDEDGKTTYEIESTHDGLSIDAVLKPDGEFVEIEKEIKPESLPSAVTAAIKQKQPHSKVKRAEDVTRGKERFYEVTVEKLDGKKVTLALDKDGQTVE